MWPAIQALPDGRVLVAGGGLDASAAHVTAICEIYAPVTGWVRRPFEQMPVSIQP